MPRAMKQGAHRRKGSLALARAREFPLLPYRFISKIPPPNAALLEVGDVRYGQIRARRGANSQDLVQYRGRPAASARTAAPSRHFAADRARRPRAALPDGPHPAGGLGGTHHRDSRAGARHLPPVAAHPALPRAAPGGGLGNSGPHLLQVRRRQPRRQPQAQYLGRPGFLQQGGGRQAAHHRDGCRPMGLGAGLRGRPLRHRGQGLHGQGELRAEALPQGAHGDLGGRMRGEPVEGDRVPGARSSQHTPIRTAASASPSARRSRSRPSAPTPNTRSAACSITCCCIRP